MKVPRRTFDCILTCILLDGFVCCSAQVKITTPPENRTVNRGSDVNISCGYGSATALPVEWIINGTSFTQQEIENSLLYRLNSPFNFSAFSLTVFSINGTTTFQCVVQSTPTTTSTPGTVNVIGDVTITKPPENRTVNRNANVTINCGYGSATALPVIWIINGRSFTQQEIMNSPLYQLNNPTVPIVTSLTVFSINATTTFQCVVQSTPVTTSTQATVIVIGDAIITTPPENKAVCRGSDVNISCGYVTAREFPVTWMINGASLTQQEILNSSLYQQNNQFTPIANSLTVFSINGTTTFQCVVQSTPTTTSTRGTVTVIDPTPIMVDVAINNDSMYITVSWQGLSAVSLCNIIMYNITVMDQHSSTIVTALANMSSVEFLYNGTNREYNITVSAINDQGISYPSDPVVVGNTENTGNGDGGDSGGSSAGAIAGGVIGGIVVFVVIILIIIVIYYLISRKNKSKESTYDDTANLKSPPGTGGTHASKGDTNVSNGQNDKVVYAAPAQTATIPHQAAASGEQYAVSTKAVNKTSEEQPPSGKYDGASHDIKKDNQGITYADLQELPIESNRNAADQEAAVTYSQIA